MIATSPSTPEIGVGPEAESVQSASTAVPPLSIITVLTRVRVGFGKGAISSFVIVQVLLSFEARVMAPFGQLAENVAE